MRRRQAQQEQQRQQEQQQPGSQQQQACSEQQEQRVGAPPAITLGPGSRVMELVGGEGAGLYPASSVPCIIGATADLGVALSLPHSLNCSCCARCLCAGLRPRPAGLGGAVGRSRSSFPGGQDKDFLAPVVLLQSCLSAIVYPAQPVWPPAQPGPLSRLSVS
jgi:hypothetical protein